MLQYEPVVENNEFKNRCAYFVDGKCTNPIAVGEKTRLVALVADASIPLSQLNRRIYQSMHIRNIATLLDVENDGILDLPDSLKDKVTNETIMEARNRIKFSFSCFAHPKRNPCKSRK
jgi:hypothetical protein